ncbi:MAG: glycosyltransferase [Deltaproteobacteria bacterium]|jgi:GT2 family glycosyltransferase|nr:glycosyltransferase [Deltaproteobacteria bacterium]MBW2537034.1 glycosyltransferase [Deltaproteobacteria bacterium]
MTSATPSPIAVSIVVPMHDAAASLPGLTQALARQTVPAEQVQILLVDNGSADDTVAWLQAHPLSNAELLHSERPRNAYVARNVGVRQAVGPVVAFTDSDCRPEPDWLERGLDALRHSRRAAGRIVMQRSRQQGLVEEMDASRFLRQRRYAREAFGATANLFVRREVFDRIGLFDERMISGGDQEFGARAQAAGLDITYADRAVVRHPACREFGALLAKAHRVGVGFGQALRYHSLERIAARERFVDRLLLMGRVWNEPSWSLRTRMTLTGGHALLAVGTAVGCARGLCGRVDAPAE